MNVQTMGVTQEQALTCLRESEHNRQRMELDLPEDWPEDLALCPFCGSEASLVDVPEHNGVAVECKRCHASGPMRISAKEDGRPHAAYSWNRRFSADGVRE